MDDELHPELNIGLSEEERDDLETLIKSLREDKHATGPDVSLDEFRRYVETMVENVVCLSDMMLKYDDRIKMLYEILRLSHKKSEAINNRITAITEYLTGKKSV
ncbi:MAG: hypothetical protein JRD69_01620 [Deltaproteobacteria bacterium]|nr:hypothetical protein [Deltaproteobacteria bacterium]